MSLVDIFYPCRSLTSNSIFIVFIKNGFKARSQRRNFRKGGTIATAEGETWTIRCWMQWRRRSMSWHAKKDGNDEFGHCREDGQGKALSVLSIDSVNLATSVLNLGTIHSSH